MSSLMQRYATPIVVLGIALYLVWPAPAPVDYSSDVVRAKAVRWRPQDLQHPPDVSAKVDPFREVLVTTEETVVEPETGKLVIPTRPTGPPAAEIESGLAVEGIAVMGGRNWAIINGRPRLPGDEVITLDANRYRCEIIAIEPDKVVVQCQETTAVLKPRGGAAIPAANHDSPAETESTFGAALKLLGQPPRSQVSPPPAF
tara:strand:- start:139447 stop:140049 length:603 start_codon:yes stop_codon:yes gene_type:complete